MPIPVTCACGKSLRLKDDLAGKRVRCPGCGGAITVPAPEDEIEGVLPAEDEPRVRTRRDEDGRPRRLRSEPDEDDRPRRRTRDEDEGEDEDEGRRRSARGRADDDEDEQEEPRPKKKKRRGSGGGGGGGSGTAAASIGGGILMILGAIVWFVVGLMNNYIFFYPPVLLVLGMITLVKGLMDRE